MPALSGHEVLKRIRERGLGCRVAMVTAVDPDFDIVEMGFDEYVLKPVDGDELRNVVARLVELSAAEALVQEYFSLTSKLTTLQASFPAGDLDNAEEYQELQKRFGRVKREAKPYLEEALLDESSSKIFEAMFRDSRQDQP